MSSPTASASMSCSRLPPRWKGIRASPRSGRRTPRRQAGVPRLAATAFRNVPGHGAQANVDGQRVLVGNHRLMTTEGIDLGDMGRRRDELAAAGRTAVLVAVDGRAAGVLALADAPRDTAAAAVRELHAMNIQVVMLTGDNEATARRIATSLALTP